MTVIEQLAASVECQILTGAEAEPYRQDSSRAEAGDPRAVVLARTTEDVAAALSWANSRGIHVSIRGGGTGLVGGANAYAGGLVISLALMDTIFSIDVDNLLADVGPGVITADLDEAARAHGLFFAPDPASAKTSTIGGNIATNAGGLRGVSHGVMADAVAGLEVVLADGRVLTTGGRTRKNVVGYDLTRLFTGSEGTLGVITRATVRLTPVAAGSPRTFRASFDSLTDAGRAVLAIRARAQVEVLELLDAFTCEAIEAFHPSGLEVPGAAILVGETVGLGAQAEAEHVLELCRAAGAVQGSIAEDDSLLEARRLANPALTAAGLKVSCDVGVPVSELPEIFRRIQELEASSGRRISTVAHAGDGNLHAMVASGDEDLDEAEKVIDEITRIALELGGTITGEHGIGSVKQHELSWQLDEVALAVHAQIKAALDPQGILTPGRAI